MQVMLGDFLQLNHVKKHSLAEAFIDTAVHNVPGLPKATQELAKTNIAKSPNHTCIIKCNMKYNNKKAVHLTILYGWKLLTTWILNDTYYLHIYILKKTSNSHEVTKPGLVFKLGL